jgi:hypothetical protein
MGQYKDVFNKDAYKKLVDINKEIEEEKNAEEPDNEKLQDLYMKQVMQSMFLNDAIIGPRNFRPY